MDLKSFLKPDWRKLILPAVFIVMFLLILNSFFIAGRFYDKYACEISSAVNQIKEFSDKNDTVGINTTLKRIVSIGTEMQQDSDKLSLEQIRTIWNPIQVIDPIIPVPCEFVYSYNVCEFYISQKSFDCISNTKGDIGFNMFAESPNYTYHQDSIFMPALNILLLFAEGYLISCAALFGYRKVRSRKKKEPIKTKKLIPAS